VLAFDVGDRRDPGMAYGTSGAASFAAGLAASVLSAGTPQKLLWQALPDQPGQVLKVPSQWPPRGR
jgi:hypothetical protein